MKPFLLCFLLLAVTIGKSQEFETSTQKYIKYLNLRVENGGMLGNGSELGDQIIKSSYYNALDIRLGFQRTDPNFIYGNLYRRPIMGIGWYSSTFHNENVGKPNALYYYFKMPFSFRGENRWNFTYGSAFGFSYNLNPFDPVDNPTNIFIGSYKNYYIHFEFTAQYELSKRLLIDAGIGFKHFSNGSFSLPNAGINLVPTTIGLRYKLGDVEQTVYKQKITLPNHQKYGILNIGFIAGSKNYKSGERNYFKGGIGINYLREISYKYRMGGGVDIYYSDGYNDRDTSDASNLSKSTSFAVNGSWEWALNRNLYVPVAIGVYLHRNTKNGDRAPYYFRAGLRYRFDNNLFFGGTIKAHGGAADIFEWTLGYTFGKNPNPRTISE